ncbi:MAG: EpsG family protein [Flavobacteriia bacterium]|nr:EpsG family protein [Flavobacteriia bacterium]
MSRSNRRNRRFLTAISPIFSAPFLLPALSYRRNGYVLPLLAVSFAFVMFAFVPPESVDLTRYYQTFDQVERLKSWSDFQYFLTLFPDSGLYYLMYFCSGLGLKYQWVVAVIALVSSLALFTIYRHILERSIYERSWKNVFFFFFLLLAVGLPNLFNASRQVLVFSLFIFIFYRIYYKQKSNFRGTIFTASLAIFHFSSLLFLGIKLANDFFGRRFRKTIMVAMLFSFLFQFPNLRLDVQSIIATVQTDEVGAVYEKKVDSYLGEGNNRRLKIVEQEINANGLLIRYVVKYPAQIAFFILLLYHRNRFSTLLLITVIGANVFAGFLSVEGRLTNLWHIMLTIELAHMALVNGRKDVKFAYFAFTPLIVIHLLLFFFKYYESIFGIYGNPMSSTSLSTLFMDVHVKPN